MYLDNLACGVKLKQMKILELIKKVIILNHAGIETHYLLESQPPNSDFKSL